jgi:hypothetical protein
MQEEIQKKILPAHQDIAIMTELELLMTGGALHQTALIMITKIINAKNLQIPALTIMQMNTGMNAAEVRDG